MLNPLVAEQFGASFVQNIHGTGLYALESDSATPEGTKLLANSFLISGTGAAQKSFTSLLVTDVLPGRRRPVYGPMGPTRQPARRRDPDSRSHGGRRVAFSRGPTAGYLFGPDSEYFVIGIDTAANDFYTDSYILNPGFLSDDTTDRFSGSFQVASLESKTNAASLDRTSVTYHGFAAGAVETTTNYYEDGIGAVLFSPDVPEELTLELNGATNEVKASIEIFNGSVFGASSAGVATDQYYDFFHFQFGTSTDGSGTSRGIFVDMDTYAARETSQHTDSYAVTLGEDLVTQLPDENSHNYFIPSTLVGSGDDALFSGGASECTCAFLEWGYWGAELELDGTQSSDLPDDTEVVRVHMGTWVAGDVLDAAELPSTGNGLLCRPRRRQCDQWDGQWCRAISRGRRFHHERGLRQPAPAPLR